MAEKSIKSLVKNAAGVVNKIAVYNDGSDPKHRGAYTRAYRPLLDDHHATVVSNPDNHGVAYAKNRLLDMLLDAKCDWVFLLEDDLRVLDPSAVTEYVRICAESDIHHLSFAHHGPANTGGAVATDGEIAYYPHSVGAWTVFSRECLLDAGHFDENFCCAWEHVEHELRLMQAGYMPGAAPHRFPDAKGSERWIAEIPGSLEKSSIRPRPDWQDNIRDGLRYWRHAKPDTYAMLFGPGLPLENYARQMIGE